MMKLMTLDDDEDDNQLFDQFKGKKTTYHDDIYTTKIDQSKVTEEIKLLASKFE